ncbi:hypothetical protein SDC9_10564 [bioreactor metagenome]|jgi:hypothetical protein|uniref:Uncharacterized protein n=1 Tax=bioreactor metagenome TaxID=1076179 RepID=A0A644TF90_9ZZZZ
MSVLGSFSKLGLRADATGAELHANLSAVDCNLGGMDIRHPDAVSAPLGMAYIMPICRGLATHFTLHSFKRFTPLTEPLNSYKIRQVNIS